MARTVKEEVKEEKKVKLEARKKPKVALKEESNIEVYSYNLL